MLHLLPFPWLTLKVFRETSSLRVMPILFAVPHLNGITTVGENTLDERYLVLNSYRIRHNQCFGIVRARAHAVHRAAPGFNPYKVIAQLIQVLLDSRLPRFANSDATNPSCDTHGDSQVSH